MTCLSNRGFYRGQVPPKFFGPKKKHIVTSKPIIGNENKTHVVAS